MKDWLEEIELTGKKVKLVPLRATHKQALIEAAGDGELWKLWYTSVPSYETIETYIATAHAEKEQRKSLPLVVKEIATDKIIVQLGSSFLSNTYNDTQAKFKQKCAGSK